MLKLKIYSLESRQDLLTTVNRPQMDTGRPYSQVTPEVLIYTPGGRATMAIKCLTRELSRASHPEMTLTLPTHHVTTTLPALTRKVKTK